MLHRARFFPRLLHAAVALVAACGDGELQDSAPAETDDAGWPCCPPWEPPPGGPHPGDGTGSATFAISHLYLGDTDRDGTPNVTNGWKHYGFDLDGTTSTKSSTNLCKPAAGGAPAQVYPDGDEGIDNAFGKLILPILLGLEADAGEHVNAAIEQGRATLLVDLEKLGAGSDYNPMAASVLTGAPFEGRRKHDGNDAWPIAPESLTDPADPTSAKVRLVESYLTENTWVSGEPTDLRLVVPLRESRFSLDLHAAWIAMDLDDEHRIASHGTIAGVLEPEALILILKTIGPLLDPSLCFPTDAEPIGNMIRQASDILADGTQDPSRECDGISIGLGFDAERVTLGPVASSRPVDPSPCPP